MRQLLTAITSTSTAITNAITNVTANNAAIFTATTRTIKLNEKNLSASACQNGIVHPGCQKGLFATSDECLRIFKVENLLKI